MAQVSLDNGNTFHDASTVDSKVLAAKWEALSGMMDDDIRERVHGELAPCTNVEFLARYLELSPDNLVLG